MATRSPFAGLAGVTLMHDVTMAAVAFPLSLYLRLGGNFWRQVEPFFWFGFVTFTAIAAIVFAIVGPYRSVWRYASMMDLTAILRAVSLAILLFLPVLFFVTRLQGFPRSALAINWVLLLFLLGAPRFAYRLLKDRSFVHIFERAGARINLLLVGAGDDAELFTRAMRRDPAALYRVVGILDDGAGEVGRRIQGIEVMGGIADAEAVLARLRRRALEPQRIVVTHGELAGDALARLLEIAETNGLTLGRMPRLTEFRGEAAGRLAVEPIALEDLLGRPQRVLDRAPLERLVAGRRVLVTGAGGSIGSELGRQIAALGPARLILLDHAEAALYAAHGELARGDPAFPVEPLLCDLRDAHATQRALRGAAPELVFHAAALKHVPLCEAHAGEAVQTNLLGTRHLAEACRARGVKAMVLISTDKAVEPASVLGATKRAAERYCQALDAAAPAEGCRFVAVRFGNVLGSSGSVVPLFREQLARGEALTVTDPAVARFFMTLREAVELVLHASAHALAGGRRGAILVLEMGQPVKILDLARQMIRLAGKHPERDVAIRFTGLRPGEKLAERLFRAEERPEPTGVPGILETAAAPAELAFIEREIDGLARLARDADPAAIREALRRLVPDYAPAAAGADLAHVVAGFRA